MGLLDFLKIKTKPEPAKNYADSSSIPEEERKYYRSDDYYTLNAFDGTEFSRPVITFEERKKTCIPSKNGLYVAEILLLEYCSYGQYPNPKNGYPGLWWFEYGIRDVGGALRSLEKRGFIRKSAAKERISSLTTARMKEILSEFNLPVSGKKADLEKRIQDSISEDDLSARISEWKYILTESGKAELEENEYVPYMHKAKNKTIEGSIFGPEFTVWSVNKKLGIGNKKNWRDIVKNQQDYLESHREKTANESRERLRALNPKLAKELSDLDAELQAAIEAEKRYEETKDIDAYIAYWESVWAHGESRLGSRWTFTLPDLYIKRKRYDDALKMMKKIKNPYYQDKKAKYIEKINALKAKAGAKKKN